jgi:hemerythrin-like domain-containing protein
MSSTHPPKSIPGFRSPGVGFEAPFDMLEACHERVERTLNLLVRLHQHVRTHGCDAQAEQAAQDILRYFDLAAPLHHQDEELHVFPPLLSGDDPAARDAARTLMLQHREMEISWSAMRQALLHLAAVPSSEGKPALPLSESAVQSFVDLYRDHMRLEEDVAYPVAHRAIGEEQLAAAGTEMQSRRSVAGGRP